MINESNAAMPLSQSDKGERLIITSIPNAEVRLQAVQLGIGEGSQVTCLGRTPGGPVILAAGRQEIAVGFSLAKRILAVPVSTLPASGKAQIDEQIDER